MSDATDTMSVQLVLCVADSVWRAAGHFWLGSACPRRTHVLLLAVLSFHSRAETAAADGVALSSQPPV